MSDIVERLVAASALPTGLYTEAAAEITRLRAELAEARKLRPFEPANYIKSPEDLAAYRQAVRAEALYEAAEVAEAYNEMSPFSSRAQAIRAMIDKEATMEGVGG